MYYVLYSAFFMTMVVLIMMMMMFFMMLMTLDLLKSCIEIISQSFFKIPQLILQLYISLRLSINNFVLLLHTEVNKHIWK